MFKIFPDKVDPIEQPKFSSVEAKNDTLSSGQGLLGIQNILIILIVLGFVIGAVMFFG